MQLPDFSVADRRVLLTGAGRGIGLAMAKALAAGGAVVGIQDIELDVAQQAVDQVVRAGGRAIAFGGDLTDPTLPETLAAEAIERLEGVDVLINNGSIQTQKDFLRHTAEEMRRQLEANVVAPTRLCQLLIPPMAERKWGRVINLSSIQAIRGNDQMVAYAMTRAGMENLTVSLAKRFSREGVTVNCIAPGWFDNTHRNGSLAEKSEEERERAGKWLPVPRLGQPDDCTGVCVLLCSRAGQYITGQTLRVDGGMSI